MQKKLKRELDASESNKLFVNYLHHADELVDVPYPLKDKAAGSGSGSA